MLEQLVPQTVFHWFEKVSAIPRGSGRMEAISRWCMDFAQQRGLPCRRDAVGNVVITKPGQGAMAACAPLILQGHMDMVCAATPQAEVDLTCCGPQLQTDGAFVWARETTLGADDGIAVAMILAVLDDDRMVHPRLEAVLTVDEEAGMQGAKALDKSLLSGRRMINLDAERAGEIFAGCAGGNGMTFSLPVMRETFDGDAWQLEIGGLRGGHSGVDIVVLHQDGKDTAHYCDRAGFSEVPEFLQPAQKSREITERIQTPRGSFYLCGMTREQMEADGYGFHHASEDGKYLIMANGTQAYAVRADAPEKDNPLRTAEMTLEDDYGMIDGVINNGRRGEELEKAREHAERTQPEKKPSIRERLAAAKQECAKQQARPATEKKPPELGER